MRLFFLIANGVGSSSSPRALPPEIIYRRELQLIERGEDAAEVAIDGGDGSEILARETLGACDIKSRIILKPQLNHRGAESTGEKIKKLRGNGFTLKVSAVGRILFPQAVFSVISAPLWFNSNCGI